MTAKLSICIPTYNRAALLGELLESVAREASSQDVEIAISDNASTDDTRLVVEAFARRWPSLVYWRQPQNEGPDRNYLRCVEISTAPYCWLMGSDDCIAPGAVADVLASIGTGTHDLILGTRLNCTFEMQPIAVEPWLDSVDQRHFDFLSDTDFMAYHSQALSLGAVFSYLSSIVVKRDRWDAFPMAQRYIGSAYSHAYLLLLVAQSSGIFYSPKPFVLNRTGNDHFAKDGEARRILIDLDGYLMLADDLYAARPERREAFLGLLRRAHRPLRTIAALRSRLEGEAWRAAARTLRRCGYPAALVAGMWPLHGVLGLALRAKHARRARG